MSRIRRRLRPEFTADMKFCARQVGLPFNHRAGDLAIDQPDPPAFKKCMLTRGLRWQWTRRNHHAPAPAWLARGSEPSYEPPTDYGPAPSPPVESPPMISGPTRRTTQTTLRSIRAFSSIAMTSRAIGEIIRYYDTSHHVRASGRDRGGTAL
jgi:hypothetical protein